MKFTLEIELGNDAMQTGNDVASALEGVASRLRLRDTLNVHATNRGDVVVIRNINGATVGKWEVSESVELREDIQQDSIATLLWDYLKRDKEHKDRRQTGYGTKTKQGLYLSISRILKETGGLR